MKRTWICILLAVFFMMTAFGELSYAADTISPAKFTISLDKTDIKPGMTAALSLAGENLNDLYSYEIVLAYDPQIVELKGAHSNLQGFPVGPIKNGNKATFAFTKTGNRSGENGNVLLGSFTFKGLTDGQAVIALESVKTLNSQLSRSDLYTGNSVSLKISAADGNPSGTGNPNDPISIGDPDDTTHEWGTITVSGDTRVLMIDPVRIASAIQSSEEAITIDLSSIGKTFGKVLVIPLSVLTRIQDNNKDIIIRSGEVSMVLSKVSLKLDGITDYIRISIADRDAFAVAPGAGLKPVTNIFDISIKAGNMDVKIDKLVEVTLGLGEEYDSRKAGVYYHNETTGEWEYAGGKISKDKKSITFKAKHFSEYAVLEYHKFFADIDSAHWANDFIGVLAAKHIVFGVDDTHYNPNDKVTRAEFAAMAVRMLKLPEAEYKGEFRDVHSGAWYADMIAAASLSGILAGDGTSMRPNDNITRQEMAIVAMRVYEKLGAPIDNKLAVAAFADGVSIAPWAGESVASAQQMGIINGKPGYLFAPLDDTTRAEAATILYQLLEKSGGL